MYNTAITNGETRSIWYSSLSDSDQSALNGQGTFTADQLHVDVAVIGAGIAGLSVAYHLVQAGRSVAVLDKALIGSGESGRTTAHLANALDEHYTQLEKLHGREGARMAAESHAAAIADIERIAAAEQIACEFLRVPGYLESAQPGQAGARELELEQRAAERAGLRVRMISDSPLAWAKGRLLRFEDQAQLQPLAYLAGLARAIATRGGQVFTRTRVLGVESSGAELCLRLDAGRRVIARDVVVATNTPIVDRFAMHTKQAAYRSYVLSLQVSGTWPDALWWDTGDPYHYVRGSGQAGVLIVGGEDHKVGQSNDPERAWSELEAWARLRFPEPMAVRARWSGQIMEPFDGLAFIGKNPGLNKHVFIATGDSGNGMTHGALAGLILSELVQGREHPWSKLYDPRRKPLRRELVPTIVRENMNVAQHAVQGMFGSSQERQAIAPGSGAVVREGLRRLAVYVADDGAQHVSSAVCPHLGCIVQWNAAEKSWDCPCHGSRFDPYGRVLGGPALRDLDRTVDSNPQGHPMTEQLLRQLSHEFWQTEVSASQHCRREAERLGETPPARVLLAAAQHADEVLKQLPELTRGRPLAKSGLGVTLGKMFSEVRDTIADKFLTSERSYRGTLLGMRHGVDLVQLLRAAATRSQDQVLVSFFDKWLERRQALLNEASQQLAWFAEHPDDAMKQARGVFTRQKVA